MYWADKRSGFFRCELASQSKNDGTRLALISGPEGRNGLPLLTLIHGRGGGVSAHGAGFIIFQGAFP